MSEALLCDLTTAWLVVTGMTFVVLLLVDAPYGRHIRPGWGPTLSNSAGWIIMELPMVIVFGACFWFGRHSRSVTAWVFLAVWQAHYIHRALVYPLRLRDTGKRIPVLIAGLGIVTNALAGYLNGHFVFTVSGGYPVTWLGSLPFLTGAGLFALGYLINRQSDHVLRGLRDPGETGYEIPQGGLYRWVSCPNYLGEIVEWIGWAIATWSLPGLAFALWTAANLLPRARAHHTWYRERFPEYPPERRALLPGLW